MHSTTKSSPPSSGSSVISKSSGVSSAGKADLSSVHPLIRPLVSFIVFLSASATRRPIHTIVTIAFFATTARFAIFDLSVPNYIDSLSTSYYHQGDTPWGNTSEWIAIDNPQKYPEADHFAGAKLIFAGTASAHVPSEVPYAYDTEDVHEKNLLIPYDQLSQWVEGSSKLISEEVSESDDGTWRLRRSFSWILWAKWNFNRLINLIHATEPFDLTVIFIGYLAMYFSFASLYISMRGLGSKFWLATSVLLSSSFAFVYAFITSYWLGVAVPLVTLSEGLPFLVSVVGFGGKVRLTRAALTAFESLAPGSAVEDVISDVIRTEGVSLLRDYALEILALSGGAYFGVNGLWQFCFMSTLILIYDYLFTATFYSAILSIKIEIGKIKQKESIRQALEEDGVSEAVAASVANQSSSNDAIVSKKNNHSVTIFKVLMVTAFLALNFVQLSPFPFSSGTMFYNIKKGPLSDSLIKLIPHTSQGVVITIVPAFIFEHTGLTAQFDSALHRIVRSWSTIISDPVISKLIFIGLGVSVGLNAYLFNAAREPAVVQIVEKRVEVEKRVPIYIQKNETSPSDSEESLSDGGIEITVGSKRPGSSEFDGHEIILRTNEESLAFLKNGKAKLLLNEELTNLSLAGKLPLYALEKYLGDTTRAVAVRRAVVSRMSNTKKLESSKLPYLHYDFDRVLGACCENVIGYVPIPVGVAGPLIIDGKEYFVPMATTEGCLVASTMRGCKAMNAGGGVTTVLTKDGMTRGPCVQFPSLIRAGEAKMWLDSEEGQKIIKKAFNSTSRFARLQSIKTAMAGTLLFIRFCTSTGDAMGMNMISKGVEHSLKHMAEKCGFEDMEEISVSGNYCCDKKPAAINWIEGRGKSVVAESIIPKDVVERVLKSDVDALVELNTSKNLVGSALAGSIGGNNAQAANLVAAIFLATGQDPAQVVESANCMTLMKNVGGNLQLTVSMPSIEVGTIGGGTILEPQGAMLDLLGVRGPHPTEPGTNARQLARIIAAGVMAAELSLCSALAAGHLVQSHMALNRSKAPTPNTGTSAANIQRLTEGSQICIKS